MMTMTKRAQKCRDSWAGHFERQNRRLVPGGTSRDKRGQIRRKQMKTFNNPNGTGRDKHHSKMLCPVPPLSLGV
jgi:hypothetical protein